MHGENKVRKQENAEDGRLQVHEVFYTIQGEGPHSGEPAVFVRLTGCNLRCWFCDTKWNDDRDRQYTPRELVLEVWSRMPLHCRLLVITGGEPMRQRLAPFLKEFWRQRPDATVQIETAGTLWQSELFEDSFGWLVEFVVSPKTPKIDERIYNHAVAFKYVIRHGEVGQDGLPYTVTQVDRPVTKPVALAKPRPGADVYLSPMDEGDSFRNLMNRKAVAAAAMDYGYKAGVQLHKVLDLP